MEPPTQLYIGLMSGSSLDGIDVVLVEVGDTRCNLQHALIHPLPKKLKQSLDNLTRPGENEIEHMCQVDAELGMVLSDAVKNLLKNTNLSADRITAIGSHGHTLRHYPDTHSTTLQVGDANRIAEFTGITTVADMRRRDMAAGGQGAPLVPAFHQFLFRNNTNRIILNIGGIANVTYLPADHKKPVTGFDTGTGNALMNSWIYHCQGKDFDDAGTWARSGKIILSLLDEMLNHEFLSLPPPKSTGRDIFHFDWLRSLINNQKFLDEDIQATLLEFTARSISDAISNYFNIVEEVLSWCKD
jgi:anhydro-N-acetylmuramic acid kinase